MCPCAIAAHTQSMQRSMCSRTLPVLVACAPWEHFTHCFFHRLPFFFGKRECPGLPLLLLLENKEHLGFPPSWTIAHHTPMQPPSMTFARSASFTSSPGEVMEHDRFSFVFSGAELQSAIRLFSAKFLEKKTQKVLLHASYVF